MDQSDYLRQVSISHLGLWSKLVIKQTGNKKYAFI